MRTHARGIRCGVIAMLLTGGAWAGFYTGGTGMEADPYQIGTVADWTALASTLSDWNKHFLLLANLDFAGASIPQVAPDTSVEAGFQGTPFRGVFDGNGHVLRNGQVDQPDLDCAGLFGSLSAGGTIRGLGVLAVTVRCRQYAGGLAGSSRGTITSCYATGPVTASSYAGGLTGYNAGVITLCYATGPVTATQYAGGLLGINAGGTVISCYARGAIAGDSAAGLVGENSGLISACFATGRVTGNLQTGGLVAWERGSGVLACYWDMDTSGQSISGSGDGRTTTEMTSPYALNTYEGWDFLSVWAADAAHNMNDGYPYLRVNIPYPGEGEGEPPLEGEGEVSVEGEGEILEGEPTEGEPEACGCCESSTKDLEPEQLFERTLGDWLLVGLSLLTLAALENRHNRPGP